MQAFYSKNFQTKYYIMLENVPVVFILKILCSFISFRFGK